MMCRQGALGFDASTSKPLSVCYRYLKPALRHSVYTMCWSHLVRNRAPRVYDSDKKLLLLLLLLLLLSLVLHSPASLY